MVGRSLQVCFIGSGRLSEEELRSALVNGDWTAFDPHTVRMMIRFVYHVSKLNCAVADSSETGCSMSIAPAR